LTESEAQQLVVTLVTSFPAFMAKLTEQQQKATQKAYRTFLVDIDYALADAAITRAIATSKYFPSIAELRESALTTAEGPKRAGGEAWGDVLKAIGRWGHYRTPNADFHFNDPITAQCVAHLGWVDLCMSEEHAADRARFIQLYDELAATGRRESVVRTLPGQGGNGSLPPMQRGGTTALLPERTGGGIQVDYGKLLDRITGGGS
jgi:hypothetical protein